MKDKFDEFKDSREYKLWETLAYYIQDHDLRQTDLVSKKDITDFWEPFLDLVYKTGNLFKQTGKLKELKVKWMRPIFYIREESKVLVDGILYEPPKESLDAGQELKRRLGIFAEIVERFFKLDQTNYKNWKKEFQRNSGDLWKSIIKFVTKMGFRELNQILKDILSPLLIMRKASLNLFKLECQHLGLQEFVMFNNSSDCRNYTQEISNHVKREELKMKRDIDLDGLDQYIKNVISEDNSKYVFDKETYKMIKTDKLNVLLDNPDYIKTKFRREALQEEFEKALTGLFKYYNTKEDSVFYDIPVVRKLFTNLEVKNNHELPVKYYVEEMNNYIMDLKILLYEMKCNGMSRIEIPIRSNKELTTLMTNIFNLHHRADRLYGNVLSYDQFIFFYNSIFTIYHSNLKEEVTLLKNKDFMEIALYKYLVFNALRQTVQIELKMRDFFKEKEEKFNREKLFQIMNLPLDNEYSEFFYAYNFKDHPLFSSDKCDELMNIRKQLESEIKQYSGRYWILEGLFPSEDREIWIKAIEVLRNINNLVQDDIRDFILVFYKEKDLAKFKEKEQHKRALSSSKKNLNVSTSSVKQIKTTKKDDKDKKKAGKRLYKQDSNRDKSFESEDEIILNKRINLKYELLRPPHIWNFPTDKFKAKYLKEQKEREKAKEQITKKELEEELLFTEIRKVDPRDFYKDGRVKEFLVLLERLTERLVEHSEKNKDNIFRFYIESALNVFGVYYFTKKEEIPIETDS